MKGTAVVQRDGSRDAGWAELLAFRGGDEVLARGHLMIEVAPQLEMGSSITNRAQLDSVRGVWTGHIESLHIHSGGALEPDRYRLRLENNGEVLEVQSGRVDQDRVPIESIDGQLPAIILELGGHG